MKMFLMDLSANLKDNDAGATMWWKNDKIEYTEDAKLTYLH